MKYANEAEFIKLADELESGTTKNPFAAVVVQRLRDNCYHDFLNPDTIPMPKMQMIEDFTKLGRQDIVARVKNGEFDQ